MIRFAKEGLALAGILLVPGLVLTIFSRTLGGAVCLLAFAVLLFFRDPDRVVPGDESAVLAPADGTVVLVDECDEPAFIGGGAKRVAIFLSIFDVHINRLPVSGEVRLTLHIPGGHLNAMRPDSARLNERNHTGIETPYGRVLVCQIAGLIARRVVTRLNEGDRVKRGERFGLIKFGSRVEVYLPMSTIITVRPGTHVSAGSSIIGSFVATQPGSNTI